MDFSHIHNQQRRVASRITNLFGGDQIQKSNDATEDQKEEETKNEEKEKGTKYADNLATN